MRHGRSTGPLDIKQFQGDAADGPYHRLRVGVWRAVYYFDAQTVNVVKIFHNREGYDWFEGFGRGAAGQVPGGAA